MWETLYCCCASDFHYPCYSDLSTANILSSTNHNITWHGLEVHMLVQRLSLDIFCKPAVLNARRHLNAFPCVSSARSWHQTVVGYK
jgi:hypothetical protein